MEEKNKDGFFLSFCFSTMLFFFILQFPYLSIPFYTLSFPLVAFFLSCFRPVSFVSLSHDFFLPVSVEMVASSVQNVAQTWKCQLHKHRNTIRPQPALLVPSCSSVCVYRVQSESSTWFNVHIKAKRSKLGIQCMLMAGQ
jgi:hypothetical protein